MLRLRVGNLHPPVRQLTDFTMEKNVGRFCNILGVPEWADGATSVHVW